MTAFAAKTSRELKVLEMLLKIRDVRVTFAQDHHVNSSGQRLDFSCPAIKDLYNTLAPRIVIQGGTQSFKSEFLVVDHLAAAFCGLSVFFVVPNFEHRDVFVQDRVDKCIDRVPEYKKLIKGRVADSKQLKTFGKGTIKYVGSNVLADFASYPASICYIDEMDYCDQNNLPYVDDRMQASIYKFKRVVANPTVSTEGVSKLFQESTQKEWAVPCSACGKLAVLDWFQVIVEEVRDTSGNVVDYSLRDKEWHIDAGRDIYCICPYCGGALLKDSPRGQWLAQANSPTGWEGFHLSMLCNSINSVQFMWSNFRQSIHNSIKMTRFYRSFLGIPYDEESSKLTDKLLDTCVEPGYNFIEQGDISFAPGEHNECAVSMGVDVGKYFDVRISKTEGRKRKALFIGKVATTDDLLQLIDKYGVQAVVIDSMPESRMVQEFQLLAPCPVWLVRVRGEGTDNIQTYDLENMRMNVDRTWLLDSSFSQIKSKMNVLPENFRSLLDGKYLEEMLSIVRKQVEDSRGNLRVEWTKGEDHSRFSDSYDMLAHNMMLGTNISSITVG